MKCSCGTKNDEQVKEKCYPMTALIEYCMMLLGVGYLDVDKLMQFFVIFELETFY